MADPVERSPAIASLASERFRPVEVRELFELSGPAFDAWTTGATSLPLISPKGQGRGGRFFCITDIWMLAIYKRLVLLLDAGPPIKAALARFIEEHAFDELKWPEIIEFLKWAEANPVKPRQQFQQTLKRTEADLEWHREAIRKKIIADPCHGHPMFWSRQEGQSWFIVIDMDLLAADKRALKAGGALNLLTIQAMVDAPEAWETFDWPAAALFVNVTELLADIDDRLLAIVAARVPT
jgi:hypothetical protein